MIKLIALDLDGTLMSPDHVTVSEENKAALKQAHESGVRIAVATGRTLSILGDVCEQVPEIDYVMYSNGAGVFDRKSQKVIFENAMSWADSEQILDYLDRFPAFIELYAGGQSYAQRDKEQYFPFGVFPQIFIEEAMKGVVWCDSFRKMLWGQPVEKFTVYLPQRDHFRAVWQTLSARSNIAVTTSFPISIDVTRAGADKGTALQGLCRALSITADDCAAFGDAENDCPMLSFAKYGFAMENGSEACKQAAGYITKSNAEDGVACGIRQILNIN